jgi:predicted nucleotidyltransferase
VYKGLNGIKTMKPLSDTDILLEYTLDVGSTAREELTDGADAVKILLTFDPTTKTLVRVRVSHRSGCTKEEPG